MQEQGDIMQIVGSWGHMPSDIGNLILANLPEVAEHIIFGAVCKQWYIISKEYTQELPKSFCKVLPVLLVPSANFFQPRLYSLSFLLNHYSNFKVPYIHGRYIGSSYGWIVLNIWDGTVTLIYPFGREIVTVDLPAFKHYDWTHGEYHYRDVHKLFVLPDSTRDDYTVVAIYEGIGGLATIKSGEKSWVYVAPRPEMLHASFFSDIILYQGAVYVVSTVSTIVKVDVQARPPALKVVLPPNQKTSFQKTYLVESTSSELYLLQRIYYKDILRYLTVKFKLHMVKVKEDKGELIDLKDLKSLKGDTFFIGDSTSIAIQAKSCMPNSIYFTDDHHKQVSGPLDLGYYNIEDGKMGYYYGAEVHEDDTASRPFWIVPHQHAECDFTSADFLTCKSLASLGI